MADVTQILSQIESGNSSAGDQLLIVVYEELRKLAAARLAQERPGQTLQATALVHEAYLRLVGGPDAQTWKDRAHFFGAAAEAMRRILINQARSKSSEKRGGGRHRVSLEDGISESSGVVDASLTDLLALNDALDQLANEDPVKAQLVKLRYFAGLSLDDAALAIGVSNATAKRYWVYARSWLYGKLQGD